MGLIDRDYMHEKKRRQRPFAPPPGRFDFGTLGMALVFCAALFLLYKVADWKLNQRAAQPVSAHPPGAAAPPAQAFARPPQAPLQRLPSQPSLAAVPDTQADASTVVTHVNKCVLNGSTHYGDAACPAGSLSSQITTRSNHNLMTAARPQAPRAAEAPAEAPASPVAQNGSYNAAAARKAECQALETQIAHWDAMARQPHSGQGQDWISEQRKQARDQQFRLHCQ